MQYINCNSCGGKENDLLFKGKDRLHRIDRVLFDIVRCRACGLVYINPQPTEDEIGKYYPAEYGPYQEENVLFKYGPLSKLLRKFMHKSNSEKEEQSPDTSKLTYLDFGCGGGSDLEKVQEQHPHWELYGLDTIETACEETKKKGFKVFCGDALKIDLPENFFDRVHMSHVAEHLHDPKATFKKLHASIKKGGVLSVMTPNLGSPSARLFGTYWYALDTPRHLFLYTPETLEAILKEAGFSVRRMDYDRSPKVIIKSLFYVLRKRDMRINPFLWRIFVPVARLMGEKSIMTIEAIKE